MKRVAEAVLFGAGRLVGRVILAVPGTNALVDRIAAHPIPERYHHLIGDAV